MTKQMKHVYDTIEIDHGTPIRDIPALVLEWLNRYPQDAKIDEYVTMSIEYSRPETDTEYQNRMRYEEREKERELNMLKKLIAKHGVPEDAR